MAEPSDHEEPIEDSDADELEERTRAPLDTYANVPPSPLPEMAPDGGPQSQPIGLPPPVPAATPAVFVCLRGPCRHYWQMETHIVSGNPASTWDPVDGLKNDDGRPIRQPRQISRTCLVHPGFETDLTEDVVYACSRWDPDQRLPWYVRWLGGNTLERRRRVYLQFHPEHAPVPMHMIEGVQTREAGPMLYQCACEGCPACEWSTNNVEMCHRDARAGQSTCARCAGEPDPYPTIQVRVRMGAAGPVIVPLSQE